MTRIPAPLYAYSLLTAIAAALTSLSLEAAPSNARAGSQASGELVATQCSADVTVRSHDSIDARSVCRGALAAVEFFRKHGVEICEALEAEVVDELPRGVDASAVGLFSRSERKAYILSYKMFMKHGEWLELEIDRRLYESVATHEIAHALARCAAASPPLSIQATEYIAYVSMLTAMDPAQLNAMIEANPKIEFESESEINELSYALDSTRFGIMAYRHYLRQLDRPGLIQAILAGKVLGHPLYYHWWTP